MTKMEKGQILDALATMAMGLGQEPHEERNLLYIENLKDLPLTNILSAIHRITKTWKFNTFPPIGVIREQAGSQDDEKTELEDEAIRVFEELCRYGGTNDPLGKRAWRLIAPNGYIDDFHRVGDFKRKAFIDLYLKFSASQQREELEDRTIPQVEANAIMKRIGEGLCQM